MLERCPGFVVNVNLSYSQMERADFTEVVWNAIRKAGFSPEHLCLEITERCRLLDMDLLRNVMVSLRAEGVRIALDDFGTGYSAVGLIKNLPALYEEFSLQYLKVLKEKAGPVKKKIEQNRDVLISYIDNNPFAEKYRDEIIQKFKEFIDKVESANDISIMLGYKDKADSLMNQYFNKFDNETPYEPPTPGEGTSSVGESNGDKPVMPKKKTTVNYNAGMLQTSWRIESEEELDTYIKSFRDQITGLIEEDKIVKINF